MLLPDVATNPFDPNDAHWGPPIKEDIIYGLGPVTIFYISYATVIKNYVTDTNTYWESVYKQLYNDYADRYRYYRISGVKIKFYPKYNVTSIPMYPTYQTTFSVPGTATGVTATIPVGGDYGSVGSIDTALTAAGLKTEYDPIARKSIGFAAPYLSISSRPFSSPTNNDLQKYMNSNYKKLLFKGGYQSVYCKFYRATADALNQSSSGGGNSQQILVGWRPTSYEPRNTDNNVGFKTFDEQGLAVLVPLSWRNLNIRYSVTITFYFKFLYEKGVSTPGD